MPRQIVVEVVGDASKLNKATNDAVTHAESLTGKLQGIGKGMVIGAGIGAFNLLSGAIDLGISKLDEAHQAFLDDQVSSSNLALALKNNIPNWDGNAAGAEAFATAQAKLGFQDDDVRKSIGQLVGVTHDLNAAQDLSSLAMDIARAKNIDLATATDIVTKASEGQGRGLKGLGIDIAGAKTGADLLAAAQRNVAGAAENWAQTNQGKLAVSNVKVAEAMEKVGGIVDKVSQVAIPLLADAFTTVVGILGQVFDAVQPVISTVVTGLQPAFKVFGDVINNLYGFMQKLIEAIRTVIGLAKQAVDAVAAIPGVKLGGDIVGNVGGAASNAIGAIGGLIPKFDEGGIVPGSIGEPSLAVVHGGERITPNGSFGGGAPGLGASVTFHPGSIVVNGVQDPAKIARELVLHVKRELTSQGISFAAGY